MALSDCEKCYETPCMCGREYTTRPTEWIKELRDILNKELERRDKETLLRNKTIEECVKCGEAHIKYLKESGRNSSYGTGKIDGATEVVSIIRNFLKSS